MILIEEELENKVKDYLEINKINYMKNTISYVGLRENYKMADGKEESLYIVGYQVETIKDTTYGFIEESILIDAKTLTLKYIMNSQAFKKIV